jgi:P-type E1-E2 ATPase
VVLGDELQGVFWVEDRAARAAAGAVVRLRDLGVALHIVTGGAAETAQELAKHAGVDPTLVLAELTAEAKAARVVELRAGGLAVGAAGEPDQDAPMLEAADVAIALAPVASGDASAKPREALLVRPELDALCDLFALARQAMRIARANIVFSLGYHGVALAVGASAVLGRVAPMVTAVGAALASFVVVGNAERLAPEGPRTPGEGAG